MNVEIGAEAALFPEKEYINEIFVAVHLLQYSNIVRRMWEQLDQTRCTTSISSITSNSTVWSCYSWWEKGHWRKRTWQSSDVAGWLRRDPPVPLRTHSRSCDGGSIPSRRVGQTEREHAVRRCSQRVWGGVKIFQVGKAWDCAELKT
jgi:hypothetical protein